MSFLRRTGDAIGFVLLTIVAIVEGIIRSLIPVKYKMKSIVGEIALVTGGANGLGRLLALRLANLGAIVVVWDINKAGTDETVKLVQAAGGTCYGYVCNVCDREDVYKKAALVREEVGQVTILINNAGVVSGYRLMDIPDNLITRTMEVNIISHFWTVKAFLPSMMENNKGHIVSIASLAGHVGVPKLVDYCASKFAVVGFDEALRMELRDEGYNIQTTVVCPYFIRSTGMFDDVVSRYVPTLTSNEVAERAITAMRCNEKVAIVPAYMTVLVGLKWLAPFSTLEMFMRGLVVDASPRPCKPPSSSPVTTTASPEFLPKQQNNASIYEQLTRRVTSSERKP